MAEQVWQIKKYGQKQKDVILFQTDHEYINYLEQVQRYDVEMIDTLQIID